MGESRSGLEAGILLILILLFGWMILKAMERAKLEQRVQVIGNPGNLALNPGGKVDKPTNILAKRVIVTSSGTPVQFPKGKVAGNEIRLSTQGNTGNIYIGDGASTVKDGVLRFAIVKDSNIPYKVSQGFELSRLWVDADNDNDALEIITEVEGAGGNQ